MSIKNLVLVCTVLIVFLCASGVASAQMGMRQGRRDFPEPGGEMISRQAAGCGGDGHGFEIVTDAKDRIYDTPQPFDPMKMMQQEPPPQQ